jgi:hypothetical protein
VAAIPVLLFLYVLVLIPFTPSINDLLKAKTAKPSVLMSVDGQELAVFKRANRDWVKLDDISPNVVAALIATEDHRFYDHHGMDFRRTVSSVFHTLTGRKQGGSTITQQLARNLYPEEIGRRDADAQAQGGDHGLQDRGGVLQGRDPRELPQHRALSLQRLRHRDGGAHLFRQIGQRAGRAAKRDAGGHAQGRELLQPGDQPRARRSAATSCWRRWSSTGSCPKRSSRCSRRSR